MKTLGRGCEVHSCTKLLVCDIACEPFNRDTTRLRRLILRTSKKILSTTLVTSGRCCSLDFTKLISFQAPVCQRMT